MKCRALSLLFIVLAPCAAATPMAGFDLLLGDWQGSGWMQRGPERSHFASSESVRRVLDGQALLVEGLHRDADSGATVHAALALVRSAGQGGYRLHSWLADGRDIVASGRWVDGEFHWGFMLPDGSREVRYRLRVADGRWQEVGESRVAGGEWFRFLEMSLERI